MNRSKLFLIALVCGSACATAGEQVVPPLQLAALDKTCSESVHLGQSQAVATARTPTATALSELLELHTQAVEAQGAALLPRPGQR